MRNRSSIFAIGLLASLLAGCLGDPSTPRAGGSTDAPSASAPASPEESPSSSGTPSRSEGADPTDILGAFTCDPPIHVDATIARANIADIRVGTHDGYDRLVFEFVGGLPEVSLDRAAPPFAHDASGEPITVEGSGFLRLTMRGGTRQTEAGTSSYAGPTDFDTGFTSLVHVTLGGDFEGQSTYYLGLATESCVRVTAIADEGAPRLVVDIEQ